MLATNEGVNSLHPLECNNGYSQSAAENCGKGQKRGRIEHAEIVTHRLVEEDPAEWDVSH